MEVLLHLTDALQHVKQKLILFVRLSLITLLHKISLSVKEYAETDDLFLERFAMMGI